MEARVDMFDNDLRDIIGQEMHSWMQSVWTYPRSITGDGLRDTLKFLASCLPELNINEFKSGQPVFDWRIPNEWRVRHAYVRDPDGNKLVDWSDNNLHLVNYSSSFQGTLTLSELDEHLYSLPEIPTAIPYVTSYYAHNWGFCLSHETRMNLKEGSYEVVIDAEQFPGSLTLADIVIPGQSSTEVLLTSYVCHPQMANNELSGPVLLVALARELLRKKNQLKYTYRIVLAPETIGALTYLSAHLDHLKTKVKLGWVVTCAGDPGPYSIVTNRRTKSLSEAILADSIKKLGYRPTFYSWLERGSDERQWCAPGVDLDVTTFARSKFGTYPGYHTSHDDLSYVTPHGLAGSLAILAGCVENLENTWRPESCVLGEPQLGRRDLYPNIGHQSMSFAGQGLPRPGHRMLLDVLSFCDGLTEVPDIAAFSGLDIRQTQAALEILRDAGLVT